MNVILLCGLNGSGKTTLGKALAEALNFNFLNDEEYYFRESDIPFSESRTDEKVNEYISSFMNTHENVVIVSSHGDLGDDINAMYDCVVYLSAPKDLRLSRIKNRDLKRFGSRVQKGGDMYEQQKNFRDFAAMRTDDKIEKWLCTLSCNVIRLDGTMPVNDNVEIIRRNYHDF